MPDRTIGQSRVTLYAVITGAGTATRLPALLSKLAANFDQILVVPTENAGRVINQRDFSDLEGVRLVESYFDEAIQPYPPPGIVLVAPCTFNSLNKLAAGIADTLALSIVAEAIGRRTPVIVALSVNPPLFAHPAAGASIEVLRAWGLTVIEPKQHENWLTLADDDVILSAVRSVLDRD